MKSIVLLTLVLIGVAVAQVNNGEFRPVRYRLNPYGSNGGFRLTGLPRRPLRRFSENGTPLSGIRRRRPLGQTSALRAGTEGAYDFGEQENAIIPDKTRVKPTKAPDANKINIESHIQTSRDPEMIEQVNVGETAIIHCTFHNVEQVGAYKQAKIWWTKMSQRSVDRPVILAAGSQIRIPDDRLRVITFPDNEYSILIIRNAIAEDAGKYKCSLPTLTGTQTTFTQLAVQEAVSEEIAISPKDHTLKDGDDLHLFCRPDDSSLSVWWTAKDHNGNAIPIGFNFDKQAGTTLTLTSITGAQTGVYTCHVENRYGAPIRRHFNVMVQEKPWEIEAYRNGFRLDLLARFIKNPTYGDNVNLRCDSGGIPAPEITWYRQGIPLNNDNKYMISSYEPSYKENAVIGKLTIRNFLPSDEATYSCVAGNDAGQKSVDFTITGERVEDDDEDRDRAALSGRRGRLVLKVRTEGSGDGNDEDSY